MCNLFLFIFIIYLKINIMSIILDLNSKQLKIIGEFKTSKTQYKNESIYINKKNIEIVLDILKEVKSIDNNNDINILTFYNKGCMSLYNFSIDKNFNNNTKKTSFLNIVLFNTPNVEVCYLYYSKFKNNLLNIIGNENKLYYLYRENKEFTKIVNDGNNIIATCIQDEVKCQECVYECNVNIYKYSLYFCIFINIIFISYLIYNNFKQNEIKK